MELDAMTDAEAALLERLHRVARERWDRLVPGRVIVGLPGVGGLIDKARLLVVCRYEDRRFATYHLWPVV